MFGRWWVKCKPAKQPGTVVCQPYRPGGTPSGRPAGAFGGTPGGGMFPFTNAASSPVPSPAPSPGPGPTPPPPPVINCHDALTPVGFTVPFTTTTPVSGGGAALQTAVTAAAPNTRLQIMDSLTYDNVAVLGCTNLTIEAAPGQTPIVKNPAPNPAFFPVIRLQGTIDGFAVRGLTFNGNGNRNAGSFEDDGLLCLRPDAAVACIAADRIIVEDCTFTEDGTANALSAPGIGFYGTTGIAYQRVQVHRCVFLNNANGAATTGNGYGACTIVGFGTVYIQNCKVMRTDAIVTRAASNMRGYCFANLSTTLEDCLTFDLGTGGSNENFKHTPNLGTDTAVGPSNLRNCVAYRPKRGYRIDRAGATMTCLECVADEDLAGILLGQTLMRQTLGTLVVRNCVLKGAGDGTCFEALVTEDHNDVFNFGATGKVLDVTDLTLDPLFEDVPNGDWLATEPALQTAGSDGGAMGIRYQAGEKIIWCNH